MRPGKIIVPLAVLAALLALPAGAAASDIYRDYATDGNIDGCSYSPQQIRDELGKVPADFRQYDPGFVNALNRALGQSCGGGPSADQAAASGSRDYAATAADGSPKPPGTVERRQASLALDPSRGFPLPLVLLGLALAALLAGAVAVQGARRYGWEAPAWMSDLGATASDYWWALRDRLGK